MHGEAARKGPRAGVVRVDAIGKERGETATPRAVRFKAFIRCNGSFKIPLILCSELMHAKDAPIWARLSVRILNGYLAVTLNECVLEGRVLFSSSELVSVMDAGS